MKELIEIQQRLIAPKNQWNNHGKYKYRSCEDILDGVKSLLAELKCTLIVSDDMVNIGNHNYVKATATIKNSEGKTESCNAFAKEAEMQKGMQAAQLSGSTSSYARKYALNGLFCIDDNKDDDTRPPQGQSQNNNQPPNPSVNNVTPALKNSAKELYNKVVNPSQKLSEWISAVDSYDFNEITGGIAKIKEIIEKQESK